MTPTGEALDLRENPLTRRKDGERLAGLRGFLGRTDGPHVRLYRSLALSEYLDIPRDDIVQILYDSERAEDPCTVLIRTSGRLRYVHEETIPVADVLAVRLSGCSCGGACGSRTGTATAARDNGGPELPPENCELTCELRRNICDEFDLGWCTVDYYLCRLGCIFSGTGGKSPGIVIL